MFFFLAGDLSLADAAAMEDHELHDEGEDTHKEFNEFDDPSAVAMMNEASPDSDEDLDPAIHNGWMFVDSESDEDETSATVTCEKVTRTRMSEERPEFQELAKLGLVERPNGCTVGIHLEAMVWRASASGGTRHGRTFAKSSGRSPKQALLRVLELMLLDHVAAHEKDRLAKKQLVRVQEAIAAEPKHKP